MNRMNIISRCVVAVAATLFCIRCTTSPVAGTETGNPDISACLVTAMALFDSTDRWLPQTYLVEGNNQLDPGKVYSAQPPVLLAKRTASVPSDSTTTGNGTKNGIVTRLDTVVVKDTVFVRDTIVVDTVIADTVHPAIDWDVGSSTLITQRIRHDSIFLVDTMIRQDTVFLFTVDSSRATSAATEKSANYRYEVVIDKAASDSYSVVRNPVTGGVTLVVALTPTPTAAPQGGTSFDVRTSDAYIMTARQIVIGTTFVSEAFRDADGDGLLFTATAGTLSRAFGNFIYRGSITETQQQVEFDAGTDNRFTTTTDNRISSLFRNVINNNTVVEQVRYGAFFFGRTGDTIFLQRDRSVAADSIEAVSDRFASLPGSDPLDHRKNSCIGIVHTVSYRSGHLRQTEITVIPNLPLLPGQLPVTGEITVFIDYGKGLTGMITGTIDFRLRTITGTYAQAGTEYTLTFECSNTTIDLQPLKP